MSTTAGRWTVASVLAVMALGGATAWVASDGDGNEVFCTTEGMLDDDGELLGRTGDRCQFTDEEGKVLTTLPGGEELCYGWILGQESKATEGGDQVFPCDDPPLGVGNTYRPG